MRPQDVMVFLKPSARKLKILVTGLFLLTLLSYGIAMYIFGGFDRLPANTPLPALKNMAENSRFSSDGDFSFAVLGDMRWESKPRIAALMHAQKSEPLFMVNLADVTEYSGAAEWEKYISELQKYWDNKTPYFHIPGGHSVNVRLDGVYPAFFQHYFGKSYYRVDVNEWTFLFLDTFLGFIPGKEMSWLKKQLDATVGRRIVIFMHHPPYDEAAGVTHSLLKRATETFHETISRHDVAAIFSAHIHKTFDYTWRGIPVFVTSLRESTGVKYPVSYRSVMASGNVIHVETVEFTEAPLERVNYANR